jgi:hypothetical protein
MGEGVTYALGETVKIFVMVHDATSFLKQVCPPKIGGNFDRE